MTKRTLTFASALLVLPFLGIGCRNLPVLSNTTTTNADTLNLNNEPAVNATNAPINVPIQTNSPQPVRPTQQVELERLASSFAERYGSYSNQSNYSNLESLYFFMTDALKSETERFVATERAKRRDTSVYYGLTTRAVSVTTQVFAEKASYASFLVATVRRESIGSTSNTRTYSQNALIEFRNIGGSWKVSKAAWQKP